MPYSNVFRTLLLAGRCSAYTVSMFKCPRLHNLDAARTFGGSAPRVTFTVFLVIIRQVQAQLSLLHPEQPPVSTTP